MIITDYLRSKRDLTWDYAKQCGVGHGVIRLPEDPAFDICDLSHWQSVYKEFTDFGIKPIVVEPMPNALHDHIKAGDENGTNRLKSHPDAAHHGLPGYPYHLL